MVYGQATVLSKRLFVLWGHTSMGRYWVWSKLQSAQGSYEFGTFAQLGQVRNKVVIMDPPTAMGLPHTAPSNMP